MKKIAKTLALVIVGLPFFIIGVLYADHKEYLATEKSRQMTGKGWTGDENHIMWNWAREDASIVWYADPQIRDEVALTIKSWTDAIGELRWTEYVPGDDNATINLTFNYQNCGGRTGYLDIAQARFWRSFPGHEEGAGANYMDDPVICIDDTTNFETKTHKAIRGTIAHEIGHVYGLNERYLHPTPTPGVPPKFCNDAEVTIMDAALIVAGSGAVGQCDGIDVPQTVDINRVKKLYSEGSLKNFTVTGNRILHPTSATFGWVDHAWAEEYHKLTYYYFDANNDKWIGFHTQRITDGVGSHHDIPRAAGGPPDRLYELDIEFSSRDYSAKPGSVNLPRRTQYKICGAPYFKPFNKLGDSGCSKEVTLYREAGSLVTLKQKIDPNQSVMVIA